MTGDQATLGADLRLGRWQDVLADVEADTSIVDAPYSERTHTGHNAVNAIPSFERKLDYASLDETGVIELVEGLHERTRGWIVTLTDHVLAPIWEREQLRLGRYVFAPLPYVDPGKGPRVLGDGPASWSVHVVVSRPRSRSWLREWQAGRRKLGASLSLPGEYRRSPGDVIWRPPSGGRIGGKPLGVMRAIVRDYSLPDELVLDSHAGHATTLLAALTEGRRAAGSEVDPEAYAAAQARLDRGYVPSLFDHARAPAAEQVGLPMVGE